MRNLGSNGYYHAHKVEIIIKYPLDHEHQDVYKMQLAVVVLDNEGTLPIPKSQIRDPDFGFVHCDFFNPTKIIRIPF